MTASPYRIGRWASRRRRPAGGPWPGFPAPAGATTAAAAGEAEDLSVPGTEARKAFGLPGERR